MAAPLFSILSTAFHSLQKCFSSRKAGCLHGIVVSTARLLTFSCIYVGASEFSGLRRLCRVAGGVALSCSCISDIVFPLLDLVFLCVGNQQ